MLSISKKTDYALLALSYLTRTAAAGRAVNTREIAEQYDIPVELLAKILQRLARAKLICSTPGPAGGYRLALPAAAISIGSVINVIDGPLAIAQCMRVKHNGCGQQHKCTIREPLAIVNGRILELLRRVTLEEINLQNIDPVQERLTPNASEPHRRV